MGSFIGQSKTTQSILEVVEAAWTSHASVPILWGDPGIGKTALVRALAQKLGLPLYILLGSTMDPADVGGLPALNKVVLPNGEEINSTDNALPSWAERLIRTGEGILFFDELTTTTPAVQAAMLTLLQGRTIGMHVIPDTVHFIAAANAPESAADGYDLAAPMANRLIHINFEADDNDYLAGMSLAWNDEVSDKEMDERARIVGFLKAYPSLIHHMPEDEAERGGAWPSYRTWDNLSKVLANINTPAGRRLATIGLVGEGASKQFSLFEESLKLPSYESVLADPASINWKELSASETFVVLNMVIGRMSEKNNIESANAFATAVSAGGKEDVGASLGFPFIARFKQVTPDRATAQKILGDVLRKFGPFLKEAGLV